MVRVSSTPPAPGRKAGRAAKRCRLQQVETGDRNPAGVPPAGSCPCARSAFVARRWQPTCSPPTGEAPWRTRSRPARSHTEPPSSRTPTLQTPARGGALAPSMSNLASRRHRSSRSHQD
eukprot:scaffold34006_cov84-Phaeocystis_antarctica.AAC.2